MFSRKFIPLAVALLLLVTLTGGAIAQTNQTTPTVTVETSTSSSSDENQTVEPIDRSTGLVDSRVEGESMILVIESNRPQQVTLTDTGSAMNGQRTPVHTVQLQKGTNRLTVPAQSFEGHYIVTISTGEYLYPVVKDHSATIVGPPWTVSDVRLAAGAAGLTVVLVSILVTYLSVSGRTTEPERIA